MITEHELTDIINDYVTVTDSWGGDKLASWMHGNDVVIAGVSEAAEAIFSRIKKLYEEKEKEMLRFAEWYKTPIPMELITCETWPERQVLECFNYWKNNVEGQ